MEKGESNRRSYKVLAVIFGVGIAVILVLVFVVAIIALKVNQRKVSKNEGKVFYYKHYVDSEMTQGIVRTENELEFFDDTSYVTFRDEEADSLTMISKFEYEKNDYRCSGACYCDDNEKRNLMRGTVLKKGLTYFLSVSTALIAMSKSRDYFEDECREEFFDECSEIVSEVENCEDLGKVNAVDEEHETKEHSVLFVCFGNICRSPFCECIFREMDKKSEWEIDSCGTAPVSNDGYLKKLYLEKFEGKEADSRGMDVLKDHFGKEIKYEGKSRGIEPEDFTKYEYILCADDITYEDCTEMYRRLELGGKNPTAKVKEIAEYSDEFDYIPDPFFVYGTSGFEFIYELCNDCCKEFLKEVEGNEGEDK